MLAGGVALSRNELGELEQKRGGESGERIGRAKENCAWENR